jgi:hypothetical protein
MSFDMNCKGPTARKTPEWIECGGGMIAHIRAPNMRLKLIEGKWRSVPKVSSKSQNEKERP